MPSIPLHKAVTLSLGEMEGTIVSHYQLGVLVYRLHTQQKFRGEALADRKETPEKRDVSSVLKRLLDDGVLTAYRAVAPTVYTLLGRTSQSAPDLVCEIDPFCYISHLSAMEHHGLTDRLTANTYITRPAPRDWSRFSLERQQRDLGDDFQTWRQQGFPALSRPRFIKKIADRSVSEVNSIHLGAYRTFKHSRLKISTLGQTYLDMLRRPDLCGGIYHVLTVFETTARNHLQNIVDEIERNGTVIEKVRAGYVLDERCKLQHEVISSWVALAQRGGSRKLDPQREYAARYSARWCISLNIDEPDEQAAD